MNRKHYIILCAESTGELSDEVNKYLSDGYILVAGPFTVTDRIGEMQREVVMQAVINTDL